MHAPDFPARHQSPMLKNIRRLTQAIFLLLFLWLFLSTESRGANELGYPVKIFLDADPLLTLTTNPVHAEAGQPFPARPVRSDRHGCAGPGVLRLDLPAGNPAQHGKFAEETERHRETPQSLFMEISPADLSAGFLGLFLQLAGIADPLSLLIRS
jgi:hypothetical protein